MRYVTKLGAYGLTVAAAFAVALAVLVSVSSTQTVEAATINLPVADASATAAPGDKVTIVVANPFARVAITDMASGVGASFAASGGASVSCSDDAACDVDDSDTTTPGLQNVADSVTVVLNIDADSGEGHILLDIDGIGGTATDTTKVITVSKAGLVGSLAIKTDAAADKTIAAAAGTSNLTVTVKNASTPAGLLAGQAVTVITTHGTVGCADTAGTATAGTTQTCGATTTADGIVDVLLTGGGVEGQAVVTARLGTRTDTATVTLFGSAKNLTAAPEQGSVEIGGSVFVVLTVTDGAGNPVSGLQIAPVTTKEVVGPEGVTSPVLVTTEKATAASGDGAVGVGYSMDKNAPKAADRIPACGEDNRDINATEGGLQELFATEGTNAAGKCVVHVTAPAAEGTQKAATRGVHTLNFQVSATVKASAKIEVAGAPASITTDAAERVDTSSTTEITVSVWDDEDVLVGITSVKVRKVGGDGLIEDNGGAKDADGNLIPDTEKTSNGQSKFTLIAPSESGSIEILITAGKADPHRLTVQFGEAMPDEPDPPEVMPEDEHEGEPTLTLQGSLGSFSGGSVDDLAHAAEHECPGGADIYVQMADGGWGTPYVTDAVIDIVNMTFSARFPDGLASPTFVAVTRCEADAMDSEGNGMEESG